MCAAMMKEPHSGSAPIVAGIVLIAVGMPVLVEPRVVVWLAGAALQSCSESCCCCWPGSFTDRAPSCTASDRRKEQRRKQAFRATQRSES